MLTCVAALVAIGVVWVAVARWEGCSRLLNMIWARASTADFEFLGPRRDEFELGRQLSSDRFGSEVVPACATALVAIGMVWITLARWEGCPRLLNWWNWARASNRRFWISWAPRGWIWTWAPTFARPIWGV